ncbi:5'-nucleotidase [Longilinea arvoryzae]|uniref:5'-nucleotidase SurE n=1 Tax=Longilinea arvoryzae TaxID=360412 RepID=A0A0S7B5B3_9CHLR|nr:5'/3'-nucleotidase SurE [Longilinea arvoryzae]GAP12332.1 5'-nucleotidase [Longilinea arvoryzae]
MTKPRKQILLTNDDGIRSPGLWAAAKALAPLGFVTIAAPREQYSGAGRSLPVTSDGRITRQTLQIGSQQWTAYAIGGTPAQSVLHAVLEILPQPPDLVVSGINYGENVGSGITVSGTVGAALEGADFGIPAIAVSLELPSMDYTGYSEAIDFSVAGYFSYYFAKILLERPMPEDVDVLKIDVPANATPQTPWELTRMAHHHRYFEPFANRKGAMEDPGVIDVRIDVEPEDVPDNSDIYKLRFEHKVAVTPLSLDMTSRVDFKDLRGLLEKGE